MNKGYIILILIIASGVGYSLLHFSGNLTSIQGWLSDLPRQFTSVTSQITSCLNSINTFIKENPWFAPVLTLCGSLTAAGIWNFLKNRTTQTKISNIQNENMQAQNNITQSYSQSLSGLQSQNQTLQTQLAQAQNDLKAIPNIAEMQNVITEKEAQLRNLSGQIELLQTTIKQLRPEQEAIYK